MRKSSTRNRVQNCPCVVKFKSAHVTWTWWWCCTTFIAVFRIEGRGGEEKKRREKKCKNVFSCCARSHRLFPPAVTHPPSCAKSSGVFPFRSFGESFARFATKTAATVRWPFIAAQCNAVKEPRSLPSTCTPARTAISTLMASPLAAGPWMVPSRLEGGIRPVGLCTGVGPLLPARSCESRRKGKGGGAVRKRERKTR